MLEMPRERVPDSTLALMRDPYDYISRRCRHHRSDLFETRFLLQKAICMTGPESAACFYDRERFVRAGSAPTRMQKTLFGRGGVQGLDGPAHRHRKQMFRSLTASEEIGRLCDAVIECWSYDAARWPSDAPVVLYDKLCAVLTRAVCHWSGVPLEESQVDRRTTDLVAMFQHAGAIGTSHRRSRRARNSAERWIEGLVEAVRDGRLDPPAGSAIDVIAGHREQHGDRLPPRVAAVEVLNLLRPTVAVSVYLTLIAHALHEHSEWRRRLRDGADAEPFVQEVRRYYPFFPFVLARVRVDFEWHGYRFPEGRRVLLDLHGTNHDPRVWEEPDRFLPERFDAEEPGPFAFIPQGGGDPRVTHRCPGEPVALALMRVGADFLTRRLEYTVPPQDLRIDRSRAPALPRSRFVIDDVALR